MNVNILNRFEKSLRIIEKEIDRPITLERVLGVLKGALSLNGLALSILSEASRIKLNLFNFEITLRLFRTKNPIQDL